VTKESRKEPTTDGQETWVLMLVGNRHVDVRPVRATQISLVGLDSNDHLASMWNGWSVRVAASRR
jgi:hypothetical protein